MKNRKSIYKTSAAIILAMIITFNIIGCCARKPEEILEAMLEIVLPESAETVDYAYGQERIKELEINYFKVTVIMDTSEFEDFEEQIKREFGEAKSDFTKGIISDDLIITKPFLNLNTSGTVIDMDKVDRIYFRYGTGGIRGESQPFTTRYVYAFVMQEEEGKRAVLISYGA